ncbi:odorant receptor 47b isoform X1 [Zeugodacus cucurbitae]|uniref:Odorant receptor n=1 Tax=Zeugodacus cucurbitae TaxID=28588 RepID=A0A5H2X0V3_ZEUCU|nr:odorant receptor 47b isoform X1 [Zeugodacus cucurbitae]QKN21142.1 odorant receptor [Zeugodacus cucurbitae]
MISLSTQATINNTISTHNSYLSNDSNTHLKHTASKLRTILAPYRVLKEMLRSGEAVHPPHTCLFYFRAYIRLLGLWPAERAVENPLYYAFNVLIMLLFGFFTVTIICDLYEASSDFVLFGEDLVVVLGLCLIFFKMILFRLGNADTDIIINEFDALHVKHFNESHDSPRNRRTRQWQRSFFFGEMCFFSGFYILSLFLFAAMSLQPLLSQQILPFRCKFPFGLDDPDEHPMGFVCVYFFQCFCTLYMLVAIVVMDSLGGNSFNQTTLNLRILCENMRNLGNGSTSELVVWRKLKETVEFHQQIIKLMNRINQTFYWNYVSQMGASTFMICLTAFEALLAQDKPMVALKFQTYMFSAFMQLLYWCWMGNRTYYDSMEVATAAYEVRTWYRHSPLLQRQLIFIIKRAQKPLEFRAKPLFGFTFASFTSILSTSYSYFTLLRTMSD